jgi:hypothetical protein
MPEDMEAGLSSLGPHTPQAAREPHWKKAFRTFVIYVASLVTLLVLDIIWMKGIAPALGVDYFAVVKVSSWHVLCIVGVALSQLQQLAKHALLICLSCTGVYCHPPRIASTTFLYF